MAIPRRWRSLPLVCGVCVLLAARLARAEDSADQEATPAAYVEPADVAAGAAVEDEAAPESASPSEAPSTGANPTHEQSALININAEGLAEASIQCFCLAKDDRLLAGCTGSVNEIRIFSPEGEFLSSIELAVSPEAINVAPDGTILVAGDGKLLRLSADGEVLAEAEAPHAAAIRDSEDKIREEVIQQHQEQGDVLPQMLEAYDSAIAGIEEQIEQLEGQEGVEAQRKTLEETIEAYKSAKEQIAAQYGGGEETAELSEEKIAELVASSMEYKVTVASISATGDAVFIASRSPVGYGYEVWRTTAEFEDGERIVTELSGCCGQMDVQANDEGVFVAENSRHRVRRFDAEGTSICDWGKGARTGVEGFGSCCNPMNLTFGADGVVYTAEDTTGRIKRYTPDGVLLSVVGAADVVPGCKKVAIGVDSTGDRVFMLDIDRNHIAVLSRVRPDPTEPLSDADAEGSGGGGLLRLFGIGS